MKKNERNEKRILEILRSKEDFSPVTIAASLEAQGAAVHLTAGLQMVEKVLVKEFILTEKIAMAGDAKYLAFLKKQIDETLAQLKKRSVKVFIPGNTENGGAWFRIPRA